MRCLRHPLRNRSLLAALTLPVVCAAGCGVAIGGIGVDQPLFVSECGRRPADGGEVTDVIVLDWEGGVSLIYPGVAFDGLDLTLLETTEGGTLADVADEFKERVREEITRVYCDAPAVSISVRNEPSAWRDDVTTVLITDAFQPQEGIDVGEGEYDPCNRQHDNAALVFGGRVRALAGENSLDEWVRLFANVCAHEIGHTLGLGHVEREESSQAQRPWAVELMLAGHTIDEMRRPQRIILEQETCPDGPSAARRIIAATSLP